ncbi:MAG: TIGR02281 family clan AA aspartic protease [Pseudomonadota bacterium]
MLFWPLVLLGIVILSLYLVGAPNSGFLEDAGARQRNVYLIVFAVGITVAAAGRLLLTSGPGLGRSVALLSAAAAGIVLAHTNRVELSQLYDRVRGNLIPSVALTTAQGEAELRRAWDGHYRAEAEVNGVPIRLMIDTGASMVLLPYESVAQIGIDPNTLEFNQPVTTANGRSTVAPIVISSIKIGPIVVFDVPAAVAHPGRLKFGLLGMSFLDQISETSFQGDRLILRN